MATTQSILNLFKKKKQQQAPIASRAPISSREPSSYQAPAPKVPLFPSPFSKSPTNPFNLIRSATGQQVPNASRYSPADAIKPMSTQAGRSVATAPMSPASIDTTQSAQRGTYDPYTGSYITGGPQKQQTQSIQQDQRTSQQVPSVSQQMFKQFTPSQVKQIATDRLSELQKQYAGLGAPGAEETALQKQLTDFLGQAQLGISSLEGQGRLIPTSLIRGEQGKLAEQANLQAQTLQGQLSNLQQSRQAQQQAIGTELGFEQERVAQERQMQQDAQNLQIQMLQSGFRSIDPAQAQAYQQANPNAQVFEIGGQTFVSTPQSGEIREVGDALIQVMPDGTVQEIYRAPSGGGDGYTLSPGQIRYDAFGNVIATGGPEAMKAPTQSSYTAYGFANRIANANSIIDQLDEKFTGITGQGLPKPEFLKGEDRKSLEQAQRDFINAILRRESGAAISPQEFENAQKQYFPQANDTAANLEQKKRNREVALQTLQLESRPVFLEEAANKLRATGASESEIQEYLRTYSPFKSDLGTSINGLGSLSERYESGGNPGAIGYDSTGGYSYGTYQLAHSNAKKFVEQSPFAQAFRGLQFNSPQWRQRWKDIAQQNPQQFAQAQKDYIKRTHFDPQVNKLTQAGINVRNLSPVVLDAIWSTAVQHGPANNIVLNALKRAGNDPRAQLQQIYALRWGGGQNFRSSTPQVRQSVYNRFFGPQGELNLALSRLS